MQRAISISLNPNIEVDDINLVGRILGGYGKKGADAQLEDVLKKHFNQSVVVVEKGRDGIRLLLEALGVKTGDEVVVQAFTCSVVPMAVIAVGATPVFVDIDDNYNIDFRDLRSKLTKKTKVIIVQHTFGMPVRMDKLKQIVGKNIKVIEDLAHGLGNAYAGRKLGTWGDAAVLSFGRDKVITGVWGGAIISNKTVIDEVIKTVKNYPVREKRWVDRQLKYILWNDKVLKMYRFGLGKLMHWWAKKNKWFDEPLSLQEKKSVPETIVRGLHTNLSLLVLNQWSKLDKFIEKRRRVANKYAISLGVKYDSQCSYLRFTIEVDNPDGLRLYAAKKNVFLGDWYDKVVAPKSIELSDFGYMNGSCPRAEQASRRVVNLPTNPNLTEGEIDKIINIINEWKLKK